MQTEFDSNRSMSNGQRPDAAVAATPPVSGSGAEGTGELQKLLADVEDLLQESAALTGTELTRLRGQLTERLVAARASLERMATKASDQVRLSAMATNEYVHRNPWPVIGGSAAVGLVLGMLLVRRRGG